MCSSKGFTLNKVGATGVDSNPRPGNVGVFAENAAFVEGVPLAFPFVWGPQGVTDGEYEALATVCGGAR